MCSIGSVRQWLTESLLDLPLPDRSKRPAFTPRETDIAGFLPRYLVWEKYTVVHKKTWLQTFVNNSGKS